MGRHVCGAEFCCLAVNVHCRLSLRIFKSIQFSNAVKKISFIMIEETIAITVMPAAVTATIIATTVFVAPFK